MGLKKGTEVEVTSNEDGFRGVWYLGKIIKAPKKSDESFVVVEFNDFVTEEDESKKLTEKVHVSLVRPLPPPAKNDGVIEVNDVVDVFHKDGWWVGIVKELVGKDEFVVCFDDPPDELTASRADVRLHFDWVEGKWDKPKKNYQDCSRPAILSIYTRRSPRAKEQQAEKSSGAEKKATGLHDGIVEKECNAEKVDKSIKGVNGVSANNLKTPPKNDMSIKGVNGVSAYNFKNPPKKDQHKSMDQEMHTLDDSSRLIILSNQSGNSKGQSRRIDKKQAEKGCVSTEKKENTGVRVDIVERECITKVVKGALSAKDCQTSRKNDQKKQSTDQEINTVDSTNGSTQGDVSSETKRGKQTGKERMGATRSLRKRNMEDSCVGSEAEMNADSDCLVQTRIDDKFNENHFQPSSDNSMRVIADKKHTNGIHRHSDETAIPLPRDLEGETVPSKRVRKTKKFLSDEHGECPNTSQGNSLTEIYHAKDVDMLMDGNIGDVNDDQVSNNSLQVDKLSPIGSDASRTLPVQRQCANGEPGTPAGVTIDNMGIGQSLPFIKRSPLWKAIESLELYKRMAQKPHFFPLVKSTEGTREGLAIAHMVNFSNIVEKTTKLQFSHPLTDIQSSLENLVELEANGFDVETVRACLTQLLSKKQMGEELQKEYQNIEYEISHSVNEKEKLDEEITQLKKLMNELVAKTDDALTRKETMERVISTLKSKQDVVSKNVQGLQLDFQNIAGSLR